MVGVVGVVVGVVGVVVGVVVGGGVGGGVGTLDTSVAAPHHAQHPLTLLRLRLAIFTTVASLLRVIHIVIGPE